MTRGAGEVDSERAESSLGTLTLHYKQSNRLRRSRGATLVPAYRYIIETQPQDSKLLTATSLSQ